MKDQVENNTEEKKESRLKSILLAPIRWALSLNFYLKAFNLVIISICLMIALPKVGRGIVNGAESFNTSFWETVHADCELDPRVPQALTDLVKPTPSKVTTKKDEEL